MSIELHNWLTVAPGILIALCLLIRLIGSLCAPVRTVKAVVSDKNVIEGFSKYSGSGKSKKYVIVFSVDGRKKSFYVSQFSYRGYHVNEKGSLTYKGNRLIEFK